MQLVLDVVDLLQLHEIWAKRPIITAFTRLESRPATVVSRGDFRIDDLLPRLARLKHSAVWRVKNNPPNSDPGRLPLSDFSEAYLSEMYPEADSISEQRQYLFNLVYDRFIITRYCASVEQVSVLLKTLAHVRNSDLSHYLGLDDLPLAGSPEWIPLTITDEIRSLDTRYDPVQAGTPATYVVADHFWPLLVKASAADIEEAIRLECPSNEGECIEETRRLLVGLSEVAYTWNRSPSVVGLCYQIPN